jgi:hypothetical protein
VLSRHPGVRREMREHVRLGIDLAADAPYLRVAVASIIANRRRLITRRRASPC